MSDPAAAAYAYSAMIASAGVVVSSLEYLAIRREFRRDGMFSWRILSSRPEIIRVRHGAALITVLGTYRAFVVTICLRLLAALALPLVLSHRWSAAAALLIITGSSVLLSARNIIGSDGSDQMSLIVFAGLTVFALAGDAVIGAVALSFIALEAVLAYVVAGTAKALSPLWRGGTALRAIMNTRTYGMAPVAGLLARLPRTVERTLCRSVIFVEVGFVFAIFLPRPWCLALLAWSLLFHLSTALTMGLNTFLWSFVATYPPILFLRDLIGV